MAATFLLYLDTSGVKAFAWHKGQAMAMAHFTPEEEGIDDFRHFLLAQPPGSRYSLLVDLVEESFHLESLPFVRGPDRQAMLARKRSQHLFGSPYATQLSLGREAVGRRDERLLFVGLTRPATLEPWLAALASVEAPLTGIYTIPLLADQFASRLDFARADSGLLVLFTPAGIRQIYFEAGRLRFSRLATLHEGRNGTLARTLQEEIGRTHAYLSTQRLIPRGEALAVRILAAGPEASRLAEQVQFSTQIHPTFHDLDDYARRCGLAIPPGGLDALPLFLHWIVRDPGCPQLAPPGERRFHILARARTALLGLGAALLLGCLVVTAKFRLDAEGTAAEARLMTGRARLEEQGLRALQDTLPHLAAPPESLRRLMDRLDAHKARQLAMKPALVVLSRALDKHPALTLESLDWRLAAPPMGGGQTKPEAGGGAMLEARLRFPADLAEDRRALVAMSQGFTQALQQTPGVTAEILKMPVELASSRTLRAQAEGGGDTGPLLEIRMTQGEARP